MNWFRYRVKRRSDSPNILEGPGPYIYQVLKRQDPDGSDRQMVKKLWQPTCNGLLEINNNILYLFSYAHVSLAKISIQKQNFILSNMNV